MPLNDTRLSVVMRTRLTKTADLGAAEHAFSFERGIGLDNGTGANQADRIWHDSRQIAASGNDDIDLNGVLFDLLGDAVNLLRVKGLYIAAAPANVNNLIVGNAATNGFISWVGAATHTLIIKPGGVLALWAPDATAYPVTAATADILRITNSGGGSVVNYDIAILGCSL